MPNRLKRFLNEYGEFILGSIYFLTGEIGIGIYASRYVNGILGLPSLNINVPHSLAFLVMLAICIFIGLVLMVDDLSKTI